MARSYQFRYSAFFLFLLFLANTGFAHKKDTLAYFSRYDNIEKIKSTVSFRPYYSIKSTSIAFINKKSSDDAVIYKAKVPSSAGLGFSYKFFYVCLSLDLPRSSESIAKYGNTKSTSLQLNIQRRHFGIKFFFRNYRQFYLSNPQDFSENWSGPNFPKRKDIRTYTFGFYNNFILSDRFSINAVFDQSERQKTSAGSLMLMAGGFISHLANDSTMVPYEAKSDFPSLISYRKGTYNTIIVAPGYGYSFVKNQFSITPVIFAGSGPQLQSNKDAQTRYFRMRFPIFLNGKAALSYNGKTFFSCISFSYERNNYPFGSSKIRKGNTTLEFATGLRF